jgi:isopentenyl-diphosphate Delta-isomerase
MAEIESRKADHIELATSGDVGFRSSTLFECVRFAHCAVPELHFDDIDTRCEILGKTLAAPLLIAAMTGGTERARQINLELAAVAEQGGYAFGLGSQRPMLKSEKHRASFEVRSAAPNVLLLGNIGGVQAAQMSTAQLVDSILTVGVDALCVHLNPAMELIQPEGDRDFRGIVPCLARLQRELPVSVIAKETGCGISAQVAAQLRAAGIEHIDVSGAGGTSWVAVETHRATEERKALGELFWNWGVPTAASVVAAARVGYRTVLATGGIKTGLDVAKALVLGASAAGVARPVLQAHARGGAASASAFLKQVELELRTTMLLLGVRNLRELRAVRPLVIGELREWCDHWQVAEEPRKCP